MFSDNFDKKDIAIINEELEVLTTVIQELADEVQGIAENKLGEASQIKIGVAETKDEWSAIFEQLNTFNALALQKGKQPLPDVRSPYFARVVLKEKNKTRDVLIGYGALVGSKNKRPIVDWRKAPVADLFFQVLEGQKFKQVLPRRTAEGVVELRRIISIKNSELQGIETSEFKYYKDDGGVWCKQSVDFRGRLSGGQGKAVRSIDIRFGGQKFDQPELVALLDKEQHEVLSQPADQTLLVLGGAGSGKTTVALYRLGRLIHNGLDKKASLVIVPIPGLVSLCQNILRSMGLQKVQVSTYDDWVAGIGMRIFKGIPKKLCSVTPDEAIRVKRHVDFIQVLDKYLADRFSLELEWLCKTFPQGANVLKNYKMKTGLSYYTALSQIQDKLLETCDKKHSVFIAKQCNIVRKNLLNFAEHRINIFTDENYLLLMTKIDESISPFMIEKVVKHSREQFFARYNKVDVDKDTGRHLSLDGLDESDYEDSQVYNTVDVEDFPILFYLLSKISGKTFLPGKDMPKKYDHMVLDEAQELSLLEVKALGAFLSQKGSVTIAGDALQHTSSDSSFDSWEKTLGWMGVSHASQHRLKTNYRSTKPVAKLATHVLGDLAKFVPDAKKDGGPVVYDAYSGFGQAIVSLGDVVKKLMKSEPDASVAILCRNDATAKNIFKSIEYIEDARLALDGYFDFTPGVDVTTVDLVKGLEFDYVIIPDADSHVYKEDPSSRRLIHVAVTRAVYQLWVLSTARPSILIRDYDFDDQ